MPAFNFQARFVPKILDGTKLQTIRANRKDGRVPAREGDTLYLYTGMRTKECRLLCKTICTKVEPILVNTAGVVLGITAATIRRLPASDLESFAQSDGFESWSDLLYWLRRQHGDRLTGSIIHWRNPLTPILPITPPSPRPG